MKKSTCVGLILISLVLLIATSCSNPPNEEMEAAIAAVEKAEADSDATQYAAQAVAASRGLVTQMQEEFDAKNYDQARDLALDATTKAQNAIRDGAAARKRASDNASAAIAAAKSLFAETEDALNAAQNVGNIVFNFDDAKAEMVQNSVKISDAETDFAQSDFDSAKTKADDVRSAIAVVQKKVADATQRATREK